MTKLSVIINLATVAALALNHLDCVNAVNLRSFESVFASNDASTSTSDSGDGESFLFDDKRFLLGLKGSDGSEGENSEGSEGSSSDSIFVDRILSEIEGSQSASWDEGSESGDGKRFLKEIESADDSASAFSDEGSEGLIGERFLGAVQGSESADSEGSDGSDGGRFLKGIDLENSDVDESSESAVSDESSGSFNAQRFLLEVEGSYSVEGSESGSI